LNSITGSYIGTDPSVEPAAVQFAKPNGAGVLVTSTNNRVGGSDRTERVVVSGNAGRGGDFSPSAAMTPLQNGCVAVDKPGIRALANAAGVTVQAGGNRIGGFTPPSRNVIAGNYAGPGRVTSNIGVASGAGPVRDVVIAGNYVGLGAD